MQQQRRSTTDRSVDEAVTALPDNAIVGRGAHASALAVVIRGPSFSNLSALPAMADGEYVADLVATLGSLDTIMGEVDR
jgi:NADH:ubiquinone oxidoreductase subunit D